VSGIGLFSQHVEQIKSWVCVALEHAREHGEAFDAVVFHAGSARAYYADDLAIPFRAHAHFGRLAPIEGHAHLLILAPGRPVRLLRSVPKDYWNAPPPVLEDWLVDVIDVRSTEDVVASWPNEKPSGRIAFVGDDQSVALALGIPSDGFDPPRLIAALDWGRATKTGYEVECLREAQEVAGRGHAALREGMARGMSEFDLHLAYLRATMQDDSTLPYPNIIAWDEAAAVLHYQNRRRTQPNPGKSFLVDAGATVRGYASDITRTYCLENEHGAWTEFAALLDGMEALQQRLAADVVPGLSFVDLHRKAERSIAALLYEVGVLNVESEDARERGVVAAFFPHGLGHYLGLNVHDVGGRQEGVTGGLRPPPEDCPNLRTTRTLEPGHVVTIEPGVYFIPMLLDALRVGPCRDAVNWEHVDALIPFGGIRIEDDVLVTAVGSENLTRPYVPGHRAE
jgi:Xaa-Pro dipeptidase